jgi:predicted porin
VANTGASCGNATNPCQESGFGMFLLVRAPIGPLNVNGLAWYTTGDSQRAPGAGAGSNTVKLNKDSDKLPMPWVGGGWFNGGGAYMGEWVLGLSTIGNPGPPGIGGTFGDPTGTYGFGASASYAITPAFTVGGGAAFIGASDAAAVWGDNVIELDAGLTYRFNPNVTFNLFAGYMIPDKGDNAWGTAFRTVFSF